MNKSFRAKLEDGDTLHIRLSTNNGLTGVQIKKLELFPTEPGVTKGEHVVKLFSKEQLDASGDPVVTGTITFDDPLLLASAYLAMNDSAYYGIVMITVFDNMKFNQDIYVTHKDNATGVAVNVYIELEQVKLSKDEATMATLKDMRAGPSSFAP